MGEHTNNLIFLSGFNLTTTKQILQHISGKWINSTSSFTSTLTGDTYANKSNYHRVEYYNIMEQNG